MAHNDGGSAFPRPFTPGQRSDIEHGVYHRDPIPASSGMTLRDYFASLAMQGLCACGGVIEPQKIALEAYRVADHMIDVRDRA